MAADARRGQAEDGSCFDRQGAPRLPGVVRSRGCDQGLPGREVSPRVRAWWVDGACPPQRRQSRPPPPKEPLVSNHYSAANLRFPGDDARLDLTDLFVFASPDDPGRTVLIIDANPYTTGMSAMPPFLMKREFHPDGIYRINIDTDKDAHADAAFTFVFSELDDGKQTGTVRFATGSEARDSEPGGEVLITGTPVGFDETAEPVVVDQVRLFIAVRSDPFFADADGS